MAESAGLLNRCRGLNPYRGFESRPLRFNILALTQDVFVTRANEPPASIGAENAPTTVRILFLGRTANMANVHLCVR